MSDGLTVEKQALQFAESSAASPNGEGRRSERARIAAQDALAFVDEDEPEYDWHVEGLLERGDRLIITGEEGQGKSTLLRQMSVQCAAGIHPFTLEQIPPVRVLLVDLENSRRQVRRAVRPLLLSARRHLAPGMLQLAVLGRSLDLLGNKDDRDWLTSEVERTRPELLALGPLYKLAEGDPREEVAARAVSNYLDDLRNDHALTVLIESHVPYASGNTRTRPMRPYGASLWSRWPEFGIYLGTGPAWALTHWRGPRDERSWPVALQRGGAWPWTVATTPRQESFARVLAHVQAKGRIQSQRELSRELGIALTTLRNAIKVNQAQWDEITKNLAQDPEDDET